ncbi:MAG TPA: patatin-like phospholipase family protein [Actinocatenispora sp.]
MTTEQPTPPAQRRGEAPAGRRTDLVLEGGGVKGIGLLGAIVTLAEHGYTFPRIAGTSAGAIVGALTAASQRAGRPLTDLVELMETLDYRRFADATLLDRFGPLGKGIELLWHDGIYKGDAALSWISERLAENGVRTWGDLRIDDDPGTSLPQDRRYRLVVTASDLSRGQLVRLPWDYDQYGLDADTQPVAPAVRASMSVPFFFRPVTLRAGQGLGENTLVDGGILSNFPIEIFDRTDERPSRWPTYGVKLSARRDARQVSHRVDGPVDLALAALHTLMAAHDAYHLDDEHVTARTVFVDTDKVNGLDFGIDRDTQRRLYATGRRAAETFLGRLPAARPTSQPSGS